MPMAYITKLISRNCITSILRRQFHLTKRCLQDEDQCMQTDNPLSLEPIESDARTLKKHDNATRQRLYEFGLYVAACMPKFVQKIQLQHNDELEILVAPEGLFPVLSFMCHHQNACFNACSATTAIDVPSRKYRFEVIYCLLSLRYGQRARVKTYTDELTPVHSATSLWQICNYFEREVYDMFGIIFTHHPDLRRILTDYGFQGHPLRKDYPLVGYTEVRYDDELKKIVYEPVEFAQEIPSYRLESPWNYYNNFHEGYNNPKSEKK